MDNTSVAFTTSNATVADVATVDGVTTVTAKGGGTATITATYTKDGTPYFATCAVTVTVPATSVSLMPNL